MVVLYSVMLQVDTTWKFILLSFQAEEAYGMGDAHAESYGQALQYLDRELATKNGQSLTMLVKRDGSEVPFCLHVSRGTTRLPLLQANFLAVDCRPSKAPGDSLSGSRSYRSMNRTSSATLTQLMHISGDVWRGTLLQI